MLNRIKRMRDEEEGFTLIELLVVILIIGILAAIALPSFLGQQAKGQDSSAKSDARNMVSQVESCATDAAGDYTGCTNTALTNTGLKVSATNGAAPAVGEVSVTATNGTAGYTIQAKSKSNNVFTITKSSTGTARTCTTAGSGGCPSSGTW